MIYLFWQDLPIWVCLVFDAVIGVIAAFIFCLLYHHGVIHVTEGNGIKPDKYLFEFNIEPEMIRGRRFILFKVVKEREQQDGRSQDLQSS